MKQVQKRKKKKKFYPGHKNVNNIGRVLANIIGWARGKPHKKSYCLNGRAIKRGGGGAGPLRGEKFFVLVLLVTASLGKFLKKFR